MKTTQRTQTAITTIILTVAIATALVAINPAPAHAQTLNNTEILTSILGKVSTIETKVTALESKIDTMGRYVTEIKRYMNNAGDDEAFMWMHHCARSNDMYCIHGQYVQRQAIINLIDRVLNEIGDLNTSGTTQQYQQQSIPIPMINTQLISQLTQTSMTTTPTNIETVQNSITELAAEIKAITNTNN